MAAHQKEAIEEFGSFSLFFLLLCAVKKSEPFLKKALLKHSEHDRFSSFTAAGKSKVEKDEWNPPFPSFA